jgi:hypothetical protein
MDVNKVTRLFLMLIDIADEIVNPITIITAKISLLKFSLYTIPNQNVLRKEYVYTITSAA